MELSFDEMTFLADCPATPLSHLESNGQHLIDNNPYQVTIYITRQCNLNCTHCYISAGKPLNDELGKEEWKHIIKNLSELGTKVLYILGGEPLLKDGIFEIIHYSTTLGLYTSLSTNGILVSDKVSETLKKSKINEVQVSIDGPNESINSIIRGKNNFNLAVNGVKNLIKAEIPTSISYVITEHNKDYIEEMISLAENLGVKSINFSPVQIFGRAKLNNLLLKRNSAIEAYKKIKEIKDNHKIKITTNGFRFYLNNIYDVYLSLKNKVKANYYSCPAGRSRFVIDANGDIYGCELLINPMFKEGNAIKNDLKDIWKNKFKTFRKDWWLNLNDCKQCSISSLCQGGCLARTINNNMIKDQNCVFKF
ncbi:MAG: radical SAM protein [Caldisphaera sp.]|uniref:radical SAM protein n=1 Tax=Caldisphaera sp. TaxID=2060322 RepID=UPI003D0FBF91